MKISGVFDLNSNKNEFTACDCAEISTQKLTARVLCSEPYTDPKRVAAFVTAQAGRGQLDEDGLFLAVVCYQNKLYCFADSTTSPWVLYYTRTNGKFYYATSLKLLLKSSGIARRMNLTAAKGFLKNGIVRGNQTLVENVYKLDVGELLIAGNGEVHKKQLQYAGVTHAAPSDLIPALRQSVNSYAKNQKNIYMPLSGGFDSNLILDTLTKSSHTIDAFTIGGETGKNEIPSVQKNVASYQNVTHHTGAADRSLFKKLPEIIWRLDGYVFERGIFLQYLLAQLVKENGGEMMICGECSDEHQHLLYQHEWKRLRSEPVSPLEVMDWMYQPYTWGNFVVMKKSALMLNSFGIRACYPFATKHFTDVAGALGKENLDGKKLYKRLLKDELPAALYDSLQQAGGSTSIEAVIDDEERASMAREVNNSELIRRVTAETPDSFRAPWLDYAELYLHEKGEENAAVRKGRTKYGVKKRMEKLRLYTPQTEKPDDSLESQMKAYYLILFDKLFLSGDYDKEFDNDALSLETKDLRTT